MADDKEKKVQIPHKKPNQTPESKKCVRDKKLQDLILILRDKIILPARFETSLIKYLSSRKQQQTSKQIFSLLPASCVPTFLALNWLFVFNGTQTLDFEHLSQMSQVQLEAIQVARN